MNIPIYDYTHACNPIVNQCIKKYVLFAYFQRGLRNQIYTALVFPSISVTDCYLNWRRKRKFSKF